MCPGAEPQEPCKTDVEMEQGRSELKPKSSVPTAQGNTSLMMFAHWEIQGRHRRHVLKQGRRKAYCELGGRKREANGTITSQTSWEIPTL